MDQPVSDNKQAYRKNDTTKSEKGLIFPDGSTCFRQQTGLSEKRYNEE
ncbi:hypothetical protein AB434_2208 [Heyndrickxia coagulans]|uniref:Uncharacterized protein n=1 Tax=Heyndrickxia coagulans TaxID=1398 RepID=A0AAN0T864_HEYCO|nr:hypothetical protein SB48_HM08orf04963 [Heyndrickxia coagulans]AKN54613.1 hypothetical protein AB434_2208 [Heyndrickxia coagulans]